MPIDPAAAALLACPVCHGGLEFTEERVTCTGCGLVYPVTDGVPVLLPDEAVRPGAGS